MVLQDGVTISRTVAQAITWATSQLASKQAQCDTSSIRLDCNVLLEYASGLSRTQIIVSHNDLLEDTAWQQYQASIAMRKAGHPIAYIIGYKEFWSLDFKVSPATLIPRPDTETLVEQAIEYIKHHEVTDVLDLGTGSGIIAIVLAKQFPNINFTAIDASQPSLSLALQNAETHKCRNIKFIHSDWFAEIKDQSKYSLIVSNPPYIESNNSHLLSGDVRFEPLSALVSGEKGMDDIEKIISGSKRYLEEEGMLMIEHGYNQALLVQACFIKNEFSDVITIKDLSGNDRVTMASLKNIKLAITD